MIHSSLRYLLLYSPALRSYSTNMSSVSQHFAETQSLTPKKPTMASKNVLLILRWQERRRRGDRTGVSVGKIKAKQHIKISNVPVFYVCVIVLS